MNNIKLCLQRLDGFLSEAKELLSRVLAIDPEKGFTDEEIHTSAFASSDIIIQLTLVGRVITIASVLSTIDNHWNNIQDQHEGKEIICERDMNTVYSLCNCDVTKLFKFICACRDR